MMDATDLAFAGIARQAELIRSGDLSPRELVELYLSRIQKLDPKLNAFRVVLGERALAEAQQAEARLKAGEERPLLGVPVAIKDEFDVAGEPTTLGTGAYGSEATEDCEVVRRLREAGAIVIGKTHTPELCLWPFTESYTWGVTRNPWDLNHTSGGSSGGSATAVAAGLAGAGQGSDGAGSIRIPCASCGLFGLKPQRGRISTKPEPEHWYGLSVPGPLTRSVIDAAIFMDAVSGNVPGDAAVPPPPPRPFVEAARTPPGKLRIALSLKPPVPAPVDPEVRSAVEGTGELLASLGHEVRRSDPEYGFLLPFLLPRYLRGARDEARRMPHPERLERRSRSIVRLGKLVSPGIVARTRAAEVGFAARLNQVFKDHDVLLTPVLARPPVEVGRWQGRGAIVTLMGAARYVPFLGPWNVTGQPAVAVPAGFTESGLPLSVQIVGRPNDEGTLLSLAAQIEAERPWAGRRPQMAVEDM